MKSFLLCYLIGGLVEVNGAIDGAGRHDWSRLLRSIPDAYPINSHSKLGRRGEIPPSDGPAETLQQPTSSESMPPPAPRLDPASSPTQSRTSQERMPPPPSRRPPRRWSQVRKEELARKQTTEGNSPRDGGSTGRPDPPNTESVAELEKKFKMLSDHMTVSSIMTAKHLSLQRFQDQAFHEQRLRASKEALAVSKENGVAMNAAIAGHLSGIIQAAADERRAQARTAGVGPGARSAGGGPGARFTGVGPGVGSTGVGPGAGSTGVGPGAVPTARKRRTAVRQTSPDRTESSSGRTSESSGTESSGSERGQRRQSGMRRPSPHLRSLEEMGGLDALLRASQRSSSPPPPLPVISPPWDQLTEGFGASGRQVGGMQSFGAQKAKSPVAMGLGPGDPDMIRRLRRQPPVSTAGLPMGSTPIAPHRGDSPTPGRQASPTAPPSSPPRAFGSPVPELEQVRGRQASPTAPSSSTPQTYEAPVPEFGRIRGRRRTTSPSNEEERPAKRGRGRGRGRRG